MRSHRWQSQFSLLCAGLLLLLSMSGCATRSWVREKIAPVAGQVAELDARVDQTEARTSYATRRIADVETHVGQTTTKAELALKNLEHLRLEQNFVLGIKEGINFAPNSASLTQEARHAIDGFLQTLNGIDDVIFLVTGHADSSGSRDYNYALAQKRAASVSRYLIIQKGLDPLRVAVTAYGEHIPLAENTTTQGRFKNRRAEIQVYKEVVTSAPGPQRLKLGGARQQR
jgi:outer membrane protein OmpA-like peptidoglycan-associated protein